MNETKKHTSTFKCAAIDFADTPELDKVTSISYIIDNSIPHLKFDAMQDAWIEFENIEDVAAFKSISFLANFLCLEKIDHVALNFLHEFTGLNEPKSKSLILPFFFSSMKDGLAMNGCKYTEFQFEVELFRLVPYKIGIRTLTFRNSSNINKDFEFQEYIYETTEHKPNENIFLPESVSMVMIGAKNGPEFLDIKNIMGCYTMAIKYNLSGEACKFVVPKLYGYSIPTNNLYMLPYDTTNVGCTTLNLDIFVKNCIIYTCCKKLVKFVIKNGSIGIKF